MVQFSDILYGKIALPDWITPFLRVPEFVRLRGVRLSNVDSIEFKDFSGPNRWEHCIAVAALAMRCADRRSMSERERVHLVLAALFHDVATPPFAHTMEHALEGFDHELESSRILRSAQAEDGAPSFPVFASQLPQFQKICANVSRMIGFSIDPDEVAGLVVGDGAHGFLLNGTLDLDNADNVTRASLHIGIEVDRQVPLRIADWLATQDTGPLNLADVRDNSVANWLDYRRALYSAFFEASDEEQGRQAFLQHLCRKAVAVGIPRRQMIWNTDEGFLTLLETFSGAESKEGSRDLRQLVQRYRLLEEPIEVSEAIIDDEESLRILRSPAAVSWIEQELSGHSFEPFVLVNSRRYIGDNGADSLFPPASGSLAVFKLGEATKPNQLPPWLRRDAPNNLNSASLRRFLDQVLRKHLPIWVRDKPWLKLTPIRRESILDNLNAVGNWSFRLSRNESLHSYPSTFVHAIPACLISALGLRGELVLDPFGGSGQTASEALKAGGHAITADANTIALLITRAKFTYLDSKRRQHLKGITVDRIRTLRPEDPPEVESISKWHHPETISELCQIATFIRNEKDPSNAQFLRAAFSAILTSTTGRKGKQHGFFADNTPLAKGVVTPPYENALELFVARIARNLEIVQRLYSSIERAGRNPKEELKRVKSLQVDVTNASAFDYGVEERSVAGIITSPPYLCMSDYTLGQRLSYYWLFPKELELDHRNEIGARRKRSRGEAAFHSYISDFERFGKLSANVLRPGGFLATVLGAPMAKSFAHANVLEEVDKVLIKEGFSMIWSTWRTIQWHRNHGYARLKTERVAVYVSSK